ncbi:hypothetical protein B0H19DRAFT_1106708 [Mycena capillaripes]|nr:hypothetical protein B0H19DRAFT_1106708 [Mycena capillaripes]
MFTPSSKVVASTGSSFPIQELTPEFLRLERSIRALSTAIHLVQRQCQFRFSESYESPTIDKDRSKVFGHLATLLTTGSPLGRQTIAVTGGSSHRGFYINATEFSVRNEWDPGVVLQEIQSQESGVLKLNPILPSQSSLQQLADDRRPLSEITLIEHAGDVFQALRLVSQDRHEADHRTLECFIIRRCYLEIRRRLQIAVELLPLHNVLAKWELHSADEIREEWLMIPYPLILIENSSIPHRPTRWPGCIELLFNRDTFESWKSFFISLMMVVVDTVTSLRPEQSDSATDVVLSLHFLRLFLSFGPARAILNSPSLKSRLKNLLPQHKLEFEGQDKSPIDLILRRWNAVVAYDAAISSLTARHCAVSTILRQSLPKVHIISAPVSVAPKSMDSIPHLMRTKIIPAANLNKYHIGLVESLISRHLSVTDFTGAVHCEASMMGIAYAFGHGKYPKGELEIQRSNVGDFLDAFEVCAIVPCTTGAL